MNNTRHLLALAFVCLLLMLPSLLHAQALELPVVPDVLPAVQRQACVKKRVELLRKWDGFLAKKAAFTNEFKGTKDGTDRAVEAARRKAELKAEADAIVDDADNFTDMIELSVRVVSLDVQISETEKQLRGLGFERAEHAFVWFKGQSEKAQRDMVSQLISRFRDYAMSKSESVLQENFLARVQAMKPKEINKLADSLQRLGANEPLFQEWLRSFSPKASRKVLIDGAKLAIEAVKAEGRLFKISDQMDKKTVQGQQEAALTVISMLGVDCPAMKELKLVASGAYDVIEAGYIIYNLDRDIKELTVATETQLANQKKIVKRMKTLFDQRKAAQEQLAKLLSLR